MCGAGDDEVGRAGLLHEVVGVFEPGEFFTLAGGDAAQGEAGGKRRTDEGGDVLQRLVRCVQAQLVDLDDVGHGGPAVRAEAFFVPPQLMVCVERDSEIDEHGGHKEDEQGDEEGGLFHAVVGGCGHEWCSVWQGAVGGWFAPGGLKTGN